MNLLIETKITEVKKRKIFFFLFFVLKLQDGPSYRCGTKRNSSTSQEDRISYNS